MGLCGGSPDRNTQFPTAQTAEKFKTASLQGTHLYIRDAVRALEPWERGAGHWLWVLTQLDNADKHRLLVDISSSSNTNISVQDPTTGEWSDEWISTEGREVGEIARTGPAGSMKLKMTTSWLSFEHRDGDSWDGNAPQGWSLAAEHVLQLCLTAAGEAHDTMGQALKRAQAEGVVPTDST